MSLESFFTSVRHAASLLHPIAVTGRTLSDPKSMEEALKRADLWLNPELVEGYNVSDFEFLSEEERQDLTRAVERFLSAARQVSPDGSTSDRCVQQGLEALRSIFKIIGPNKFLDAEALKIGKRIEGVLSGRLPGYVRGLRFETGEDASGEPALWIWVELDDEAVEASDFSEKTKLVRDTIVRAVAEQAVGRWPYVRFESASERAESQREGAA